MSDEALRAFLQNLRVAEGSSAQFTIDPAQAFTKLGWQHAAEPGLWVVKWVQGAVAAGAVKVEFVFQRRYLEVHCHGDFQVDARALVEKLLGGQIPSHRSERHWVAALHGVCGEPLERLTLISRQGTVRQMITFQNGELRSSEDEVEAGPSAFSLLLIPSRPPLLSAWRSTWTPLIGALTTRLRYCPIPVLVKKAQVSRQSPFSNGALLNWIEPAVEGQHAFLVYGSPRQIISPALSPLPDVVPEAHKAALMVTMRRRVGPRGTADVYWMRDGALIGPIKVVGPTGAICLDIICPGDHPRVNLSEWALQDPATFFPDKKVLEVARQLVTGLESLIVTLAERQDEHRYERRLLSARSLADAKLLRALEGPVLGALRGFSQREALELAAH